LLEDGKWWAEDLPTWSHAVTSQTIDGRLYNIRVAFIKHDGFCTTLLSVYGPLTLGIPVTDSGQRFPITNTWNVDGQAEVTFGYAIVKDASFEQEPSAVSISVMPSRDAHVLLEAMTRGDRLNVSIGDIRLAFDLNGAGPTIDAALGAAEKGLGGR
jgi:hypothetical protein